MEPIFVLKRAFYSKGKAGLVRWCVVDTLLLLQSLAVFSLGAFFNCYKHGNSTGLSSGPDISIIKAREVDLWSGGLPCISRYSSCCYHALQGRYAEVNSETSNNIDRIIYKQ